MIHRRNIRRLAAILASALLLLSQLALPAASLASGVDQTPPATLPSVTVTWQDANGNSNAYYASYATDGMTRRLWVQLPTDAFTGSLTLSVAPPAAPEGVSYTCDASAYDLTGFASSADYTSAAAALVTVYQDGTPVDQYNVYISSLPVPVETVLASVYVYYVDADTNATLDSDTLSLEAGSHTVYPTKSMPEGYAPTAGTATEYTVNVDAQGNPDQPSLTFYYTMASAPVEAAKGSLTVYYTDLGGVELLNSLWMEPTDGQVVTAPEIGGYTLSPNSQSSYTVSVLADGTTSPAEIRFEYSESSTEPDSGAGDGGGAGGSGDGSGTGDSSGTGDGTGDSGDSGATTPTLTAVGRYCYTKSSVNLRSAPEKKNGNVVTTVDANTYIWLYGYLSPDNTWASVSYNGTDCYVMAEFISELSQAESDTYNYAPGHVPFPGTETEPPATPTATINVHYVLENGDPVADTQTLTLTQTVTTVTPTANVSADYQLSASYPSSVEVTVLSQDVASPSEVVFYYEPVYVAPATATIILHYTSTDGSLSLPDGFVTAAEGSNTVVPDIATPDGYQIAEGTPASYEITVDSTGAASLSEVTFTFAPVYVAPATGTVIIHYVASDNSLSLPDGSASVTEGSNTVVPGVATPDGYQLAQGEPTSYEVTVDSNGVVTPAEVTFTFAPITVTPATGTVVIHYASTDNSLSLPDGSASVAEGSNTVVPGVATPEGYQIAEGTQAAYDVTVDSNGVVTPAEVTFTFAPITVTPATGTVIIHYVASDSSLALPDVSAAVTEGDNDVGPTIATPDGYQLSEPSSYNVKVDASGAASPAEITFTYAPVTAPVVQGSVTITYVDDQGATLAAAQTVALQVGQTVVTPSASIAANYTLTSAASVTVTVDSTGKTSPDTVTFTYHRGEITGKVTVQYVDQQGSPIATEQVKTLPQGDTVISPEAAIPSGYQLALDCPASYTVRVDENGLANPATVTFYYSKNTPQYMGYGLINTRTALRNDATTADSSLIGTLEQGTLVIVNGQPTVNGVTWAGVQTLDSKIGLVLDSSVTRITDAEAQPYIDAYKAAHATATPSPTPAPTAVPAQLSGYYVTIGSNVPLRMVNSQYSEVRTYLAYNTVVYVSGQLYNEGYGWHITTYGTLVGYVRADQLRKLSDSEVETYKQSISTATPTPAVTPQPYNPNANSSYGYVTTNSVNFRVTPGTGASMKFLNRYAFSLVLGTRVVNGVTWYNINQNGTVGWVNGNFFHVMSLAEMEGFLTSSEYYQGIANNSGTGTSSGSTSSGTSSSTGSATSGTVSSVEDWNVGVWKNPNAGASTTYAPFDPNATPAVTASYEPFNPNASATPSANGVGGLANSTDTPEPSPTFVLGTMIPISYSNDNEESQTSTPWVLIAGIGVLVLGGAGGVYAYAASQNKKRRAAAARAAAQRRNGQGGQGGQPQNPYQRRAVAAPPYAGSQQRQDGNRSPYQQGQYRNGSAQPTPYGQQRSTQSGSQQSGGQQRPVSSSAQRGAGDGLRAAPPLSGTRQAPYDSQSRYGGANGDNGYNPYARPQSPDSQQSGYRSADSSSQSGGAYRPAQDGQSGGAYRPTQDSQSGGAYRPTQDSQSGGAYRPTQDSQSGGSAQRRPRSARDSGAGRSPDA